MAMCSNGVPIASASSAYPASRNLAIGAIATGGVRVLNDEVVGALGIDEGTIPRVAAACSVQLSPTFLGESSTRRLNGIAGPYVSLCSGRLVWTASASWSS